MRTINFSEKYDKLTYPIFPTIRGKSWYPMRERYYDITVKREPYCVGLLFYQKKMRIKNIPLDFLKHDVSPWIINSHEDFIKGINRFRRYSKIKSSDEKMTILLFHRIMS